jgi:serine/threonine protein kinase
MYLQYYDGGDLHKMIQKMKNMPTNMRLHIALFFLKQLTQAVLYCHSNRICHLDIKPANCLLQKGTWNLALADFGLSIELQYDNNNKEIPMKAQPQGTPGFVAPELNSNKDIMYSKLDIYAIGVVFLQMLTGFDLCKYFNDNDFCFQQNPEVEFCNNEYIQEDMMQYDVIIRKLLNRICEYNPDNRIELKKLLKKLKKLTKHINNNDILNTLNPDNNQILNKYLKSKSKYMKLKKLIF